MAKGNSWYTSLSYVVRVVLAIIPVTAWLVHAFARISSGKPLGIIVGILSLFGIGFILWIIDLIFVLLKKNLLFA